MKLIKNLLLICALAVAAVLTYRHLTYELGYCPETQHSVTDAELLKISLELREGQIAYYGGIDAYEKKLISINRRPEEAGRDFDVNDPDCCKVYRGPYETKRGCGIDTNPICVRLRFPPLKKLPEGYTYYQREGRTYLFDDCGKLTEDY